VSITFAISIGRSAEDLLMTTEERVHKLRHDLSNPLAGILAETQLLLLNESRLDPETLSSLREIEALAIRMRGILRDT
jgi:signal transduction histidine kinase